MDNVYNSKSPKPLKTLKLNLGEFKVKYQVFYLKICKI